MLIELRCDKFNKECIDFHEGLNVVLGTSQADNSIGKTTFLMILDFVFGGDDYIKLCGDVHKQVGEHEIQFSFMFGNEKFFFSRNTVRTNIVKRCDNNYKPIGNMSINEYRLFLQDKYNLNIPFGSFRDIVGRYSRIYGKQNVDEHWPLNIVKKEPNDLAIKSLLVLFEMYDLISQYAQVYDNIKEKYEALKNAQKFSLLPQSVTKAKVKENLEEIKQLRNSIAKIENKLDVQFVNADSQLSEEVVEVKRKLTIAKMQRSKLYAKIFKLKENLAQKSSPTEEDFKVLLRFFPNCNLSKITEIEQFHSDVSRILAKEFANEKTKYENELLQVDLIIDTLNKQLLDLTSTTNISTAVLKQYAELRRNLERYIAENNYYEQQYNIIAEKKQAKANLDSISNNQLHEIENKLNNEMNKINDYIYEGKKTAPSIKFNNMSYEFFTPNDTGTGSSYKGLVVYDLAILSLTRLPFVLHDSILLKQISDTAMLNIIKLYSKYQKQIFIAFDKQDSYGDECKNLLEANKVLQLSPNGQELFGRSWNEK